MISAEIDIEQLKTFIKLGKESLEKALELTAVELMGNVRKEAPVDQGRLAGSFFYKKLADGEWTVYSDVVYAKAVNYGLPPTAVPYEPIKVWAERKGLNPYFVWLGIREHGTEGNNFAERAIEATETRAEEFLSIAIRDAMGGM